jgi:hypothetical protein
MSGGMYNIEVPRFASASANPSNNWNEVDHLDFDLLAEYLLNDGNPFSGTPNAQFDYRYVRLRLTVSVHERSQSDQPQLVPL